MISEQNIRNARILIVDDRQANVTLLEDMLHEEGYLNVTGTFDPTAVTGLHQENNFDLILLDIEMPGMDGFQVMSALQESDCHGYAPILVVTAHGEHKLKALASGAKDFISTPLNIPEIRTRIRNMLEVRLLYMQLEGSNRALEFLALHDGLTGLPNRRLLFDRLSSAILRARRNANMMAVLFLDLDMFKEINDCFGHDAGDELLSEMGRRLEAAVRQEDTVARLGGDEFILVLPELKEIEDIEIFVPKLIAAVARPCNISGTDMNITASIGVSIYPTHGESPEILMKRADMALYRSKHLGKNKYCIASDLDSQPYGT
jgi:diguanylate cyclase (GGDEF)-like protein